MGCTREGLDAVMQLFPIHGNAQAPRQSGTIANPLFRVQQFASGSMPRFVLDPLTPFLICRAMLALAKPLWIVAIAGDHHKPLR